MNLEQRILEIVCSTLSIASNTSVEHISRASSLAELGVDSLGFIAVTQGVQIEFDAEIASETLLTLIQCDTVGDVVDHLYGVVTSNQEDISMSE